MSYHGTMTAWKDGCRCDACRGYAKRVLGIANPSMRPPRFAAPKPKKRMDSTRIKAAVAESGRTVDDVAKAAMMPKSTLKNYMLYGVHSESPTLRRIAYALGVEASELVEP